MSLSRPALTTAAAHRPRHPRLWPAVTAVAAALGAVLAAAAILAFSAPAANPAVPASVSATAGR